MPRLPAAWATARVKHDDSAASRSSVGWGPWLVPPYFSGSSTGIVKSPEDTSQR